MTWAVVPAAGAGRRFGGALPKQYVQLFGRSILHHTLERLARHPDVSGLVVALAADDSRWPGWRELCGKPVIRCEGGAERSASVLAGLKTLPDSVRDRDWVLVHDAARPCLPADDLTRLIDHGRAHSVGALLAAPVRDTLKLADERGECASTVPREGLWRALTPQVFRRATLTRALEAAIAANEAVTDEAMAIERLGLRPLLVEGSEVNIKVTRASDLPLAEFLLGRLAGGG